LKHAQTCLYYNKVTWFPIISHAIKSFRELQSHAMYVFIPRKNDISSQILAFLY